jgi:hypothetical protein
MSGLSSGLVLAYPCDRSPKWTITAYHIKVWHVLLPEERVIILDVFNRQNGDKKISGVGRSSREFD